MGGGGGPSDDSSTLEGGRCRYQGEEVLNDDSSTFGKVGVSYKITMRVKMMFLQSGGGVL